MFDDWRIFAFILLFWFIWRIEKIARHLERMDRRLRERFPTDKEADFDWSQDDPMGHAEAHGYLDRKTATDQPPKKANE